jgi:hypothetical protein
MRFVLVLVVAVAGSVALGGCGDDGIAPSTDLAQPIIDLSQPGLHCGGVVCMGACAACVEVLGGICAPPCKTAAPACTGGASCRSAADPDGGTSNVHFSGDCAGYDGVCL